MSALPDFFRQAVTQHAAEEDVKRRLDSREETLLDTVRTQIYERPTSPYLKLLHHAGCEYADFRAHIQSRGVENTLLLLAREGVYLTSEEFKGKKPVVRRGLTLKLKPTDLENKNRSAGYRSESSGTSNDPIRSFVSLDLLALRAPITRLFFEAHDLIARKHAIYDATLPAAAALNNLLIYARIGVVTERWFARKIPVKNKVEGVYHSLITRAVLRLANFCGPSVPVPEYIDIHQTDRIARWVADHLRHKRLCCITTPASNAVRIARVATTMGISLDNTRFIVTGEPFTDAKKEVIKNAGATATPRYAYGGSINIGFGCAKPLHTDDIHINQHLLALVPNPAPITDSLCAAHPLLCTTIDPSFPRVFLNVESGDYATFTERNCDCMLGRVGLNLHLHHVRSFEKFTSEGMNFYYGDLYELLENAFPHEFGGGPGDYQLVEEEDNNGHTRLTLVVHPAVGPVREAQLVTRLQLILSEGSRSNTFMANLWRDAGTFRIRRDIPHSSRRGKILPLHISTRH